MDEYRGVPQGTILGPIRLGSFLNCIDTEYFLLLPIINVKTKAGTPQ